MTTWRPPMLTPDRLASITPRQAQILALICFGCSNRIIAKRLGISEDSVKTHAVRLYRNLGALDRVHAAALACSGQVQIHVKDQDGRTA